MHDHATLVSASAGPGVSRGVSGARSLKRSRARLVGRSRSAEVGTRETHNADRHRHRPVPVSHRGEGVLRAPAAWAGARRGRPQCRGAPPRLPVGRPGVPRGLNRTGSGGTRTGRGPSSTARRSPRAPGRPALLWVLDAPIGPLVDNEQRHCKSQAQGQRVNEHGNLRAPLNGEG